MKMMKILFRSVIILFRIKTRQDKEHNSDMHIQDIVSEFFKNIVKVTEPHRENLGMYNI